MRKVSLLALYCSALVAANLFAQQPAPAAAQPVAPPPAPAIQPAAAAASSAGAPMISSVSAPAGYVLSANDQIAVEVFGEDDLRTNARLNGEGNLSLPLLGSVRLSGLTLTQAAARLTELYGKDYLV
ncbi:MAG: polysaccharide biosynthesis/export family protein, partial [Chthoniobacterales bacterium]